MAENSYIKWIQELKGILIILVVIGHAILPSVREEHLVAYMVFNLIYSFHMYAFFFVSGILYEHSSSKKKKIGYFVKNKIKKLLIPYWCFTIFAFAVYFFASFIPQLNSILGGEQVTWFQLARALITDKGNVDTHLWFVFQMFLIQLINKIAGENIKKRSVLCALIMLNCFSGLTDVVSTTLTSVVKYLIPFVVGRILHDRLASESDKCFIMNWKTNLICVIIFICGNIVQLLWTMDSSTVIMVAVERSIYLLTGFSMTLVLINLCKYREYSESKNRLLTALGGYSFDIYLMHQPFIVNGVEAVLSKIVYSDFICVIVASLIGMAFPLFLSSFILKKFKLTRILIGRG